MMKKRLAALALTIIMMIGILTSCSGYSPIESTEEEAKTVLSLTVGENEYKVPYELYRAFFLTYKADVDKGDASVWSSDEKNAYIEKINGLILSRIADIYAVFSIAKEIGIDVYSKDYDKKVKEYVKAGVDGGVIGDVVYEGFGGDYDKYIESLREMNLNYSVSDLLFRYSFAVDDIYYYYKGNVSNDATLGKLEYTKDDVRDFYFGNGTRRVMSLYLSTVTTSFTEERVWQIRDTISRSTNESQALAAMINYSTLGAGDLADGIIIGEYNYDALYYEALTNEALSLSLHETSEPVRITTGTGDGFFILFCMQKSEQHFEDCYDNIKDAYEENEIGKMLSTRAAELKAGVSYTSEYSALVHADIKMNEASEQ